MKQYRYTLDKSSKKFICPSCGKKRFVRYIDIQTDQFLEGNFGRCDRETSCGYFETPNATSTIEVSNTLREPSKKPTFHDPGIVEKSIKKYQCNHLVSYLYSNYDHKLVDEVAKKYKIGTAEYFKGGTVFWQIDNYGNVRGGKIMAYDKKTGKRIKGKNDKAKINWVHRVMKKSNFNLKQCLFGLHLLNKNTKQVALVESEKTAIIMSLEIQDIIWMATGSLTGFKYDYLKPLKGIQVIAYPDKGGFAKWSSTADILSQKGFNITISEELEKQEYRNGWDLVDVLEYQKTTMNYTYTERIVYRLSNKNSAIKKLIEKFDLRDEYDQEIRLIE